MQARSVSRWHEPIFRSAVGGVVTDARPGGPGRSSGDRWADTSVGAEGPSRAGGQRLDASTIERLVDELTETCLQLEAADNVRDALYRHNVYAPDGAIADISSAVVALVADRLSHHIAGRLSTLSSAGVADRAGVDARARVLVEQIESDLQVLAQAHALPLTFLRNIAERRAAGEYAYAPPAVLHEIDQLIAQHGGFSRSVRIEVVETAAPGDLKVLVAPSPVTPDPNGQSPTNGHAAVNGHAATNGRAAVDGHEAAHPPTPTETPGSDEEKPPSVAPPGPDDPSRVQVTAVICSDEIAQAFREAPNRGRPIPEHEPLTVTHLTVPDGLRSVVVADLLPGQIVTIEIMSAADRRAYDHQVRSWASDSASQAAVGALPPPPPSRSISYLLTGSRALVHADGSRRMRELLDEYLYGGIVELDDVARELGRRSTRRSHPRCHQAEVIG